MDLVYKSLNMKIFNGKLLNNMNDFELKNEDKTGDKAQIKFKMHVEKLGIGRSSTGISWFQYALYLHILILYVFLFFFFYELHRTKDLMYELHMNSINMSLRCLQVEKDLISLEVGQRIMSSSTIDDNGNSEEEDERTMSRFKRDTSRTNLEGKRRRSRPPRKSGFPRAAHFIGALPDPLIRDEGLLSPWMFDPEAIQDFNLKAKIQERGRESVEIQQSGLYFIYAQVVYQKSPLRNLTSFGNKTVYYMNANVSRKAGHSSFLVMRAASGGGEEAKVLAGCAALGDPAFGGEASCFTGRAVNLNSGDLVFVKQRERDRQLLMGRGQTYLGLILLNKRSTERRARKQP